MRPELKGSLGPFGQPLSEAWPPTPEVAVGGFCPLGPFLPGMLATPAPPKPPLSLLFPPFSGYRNYSGIYRIIRHQVLQNKLNVRFIKQPNKADGITHW